MKIKIDIKGCDDTTTFFKEVTGEEMKFLESIAIISMRTSRYQCMPVLQVRLALIGEEEKHLKELEEDAN